MAYDTVIEPMTNVKLKYYYYCTPIYLYAKTPEDLLQFITDKITNAIKNNDYLQFNIFPVKDEHCEKTIEQLTNHEYFYAWHTEPIFSIKSETNHTDFYELIENLELPNIETRKLP